jgi:hypothetical protein
LGKPTICGILLNRRLSGYAVRLVAFQEKLSSKHSSIHGMRYGLLICILAISASIAPSQADAPVSDKNAQFIIGRRTFFDFGPPFDFYELFVVETNARGGASIERITLTPPGDACVLPAKIEAVITSVDESPAQLLGTKSPCRIPEKKLRSELKRCKHCPVFSGANVSFQVQCGAKVRIIRADILDKDMFDPKVNTPEYTAWTMQLLGRITHSGRE